MEDDDWSFPRVFGQNREMTNVCENIKTFYMTKVFEKLSRIEFVFGVLGFKAVCFVKLETWRPPGSHQLGKHQRDREMDKPERSVTEVRGIHQKLCLCMRLCTYHFAWLDLFCLPSRIVYSGNLTDSKTCDFICSDPLCSVAVSYLRVGFYMYAGDFSRYYALNPRGPP